MDDGRNTILIADGDAGSRDALRRLFERHAEVAEAGSVSEALEEISGRRETLAAALADAQLPGGGVLELLRGLRRRGVTGKLPVFVMVPSMDDGILREAFRLGATELLVKPVTPCIATRRVLGVVELYKTRARLGSLVEEQREGLHAQAEQIIELGHGMVEALAAAIEFRSEESGVHVRRIRGITRLLMSETRLGEGLDAGAIEEISLAAVLHDVGKIAVPDAILNKPGRLTPEEFEIMKTHTVKGEALLRSIPQLRGHDSFVYACDIARHHHERADGGGYPDGLRAGQLSPWARAVSVADVYDALRMERVYKPAYTRREARDMIHAGRCGAFDEELLSAFDQAEEQIDALYGGGPD